jgi:hypothetical protein
VSFHISSLSAAYSTFFLADISSGDSGGIVATSGSTFSGTITSAEVSAIS